MDVKLYAGDDYNMRKDSGQIAVEYVLLLVIGVAVWLILVTELVSRNPNSPGLVVRKWYEIINAIGSDPIDSPSNAESDI